MRNESQHRVFPALVLITATHLLYIEGLINDRNTSLYLDEGCTTFSCHCRPCLDFIKSSLNLTPPMFNQVFARSKSRSWHNSHVVLIVALPKWARALSWWKVLFQWHHIGSQTLIYVESAHNPITFPLADPLEDDKSTFEAYTDSTPH